VADGFTNKVEAKRMTILRRVGFVISILAFASMFPAYAAAASFKLIIGYAALNARVSPLWIAEEQGFFTKYGIDPQPIYVRGAPTLVAGLSSGDIQVGRSGGSATLAAVGAGHDFKIVATFSSHNSYDLVTRSNIKRPED
jgi:ABC-type nitrate/sulfonate/bicarbonate transport system substrate-binding protein